MKGSLIVIKEMMKNDLYEVLGETSRCEQGEGLVVTRVTRQACGIRDLGT